MDLNLKSITEEEIKIISSRLGLTPSELLNQGLLTFLAKRMPPRLKDYTKIGTFSGASASRLEKGTKGEGGVPERLEKLFDSYGAEIINSDLFKYSMQLVENTLNEILMGEASKSTQRRILKEINNIEFISLMMQISIRLIGIKLQEEKQVLTNVNLEYTLTLLREKPRKFSAMFKKATKEGTLAQAKVKYFQELENFSNELKNQYISIEESEKMNVENTVLMMLGDQAVISYLMYSCQIIQKKVQENFGQQFNLFFVGNIDNSL